MFEWPLHSKVLYTERHTERGECPELWYSDSQDKMSSGEEKKARLRGFKFYTEVSFETTVTQSKLWKIAQDTRLQDSLKMSV